MADMSRFFLEILFLFQFNKNKPRSDFLLAQRARRYGLLSQQATQKAGKTGNQQQLFTIFLVSYFKCIPKKLF
jgi:hypothetical protein